MSYILSFKLPHSLLHRLEGLSAEQGVSKGALVREAIELLVEKVSREGGGERVQKVTELLLKKKKIRTKVNWDQIRKMAAKGLKASSPEEEVQHFRRRGL